MTWTKNQEVMVNERIQRLMESVHVDIYPLCITKARLITESYKETEGEPTVIRRAKAQANVLDKMPISIEDGELIVGNAASKPMGVEVDFWRATWPQEELDGLKEEGWGISEEDEVEVRLMNEYWRGKTYTDRSLELFDDERLWPYVQSGVVLPQWISREEGYGGGLAISGMGLGSIFPLMVWDYPKILHGGVNKLLEEAEQELRNTRIMSIDSAKKVHYLKAVLIAYEAIIRFANRFAVLAADMAAKEKDPVRKKELERIAETCWWVPANPARNFYEAIQSFWFQFLIANPHGALGLGRFDQYMYPFYIEDIAQGRITDDEILELLQCLRIKDMQLNQTGGLKYREKISGLAKWHNCIIGGQRPNGEDATNELSYLILEAAKRCPTPHHTITIRVHEGTPEALMLKGLEVVKTGIGMPAFIGDKSYVEYLLAEGVPLKTARDYAIGGCLDVALMGQSHTYSAQMFIIPLVFDFFMHNGTEPKTGKQIGPKTGDLESFKSFDDLMSAFKKHLAHFMDLHAEYNNTFLRALGDVMPDPVASSLVVDGIKEGKDIAERKLPLANEEVMMAVGMINVADSLAAIKKLVFDEKKVTMKELKVALGANWEGYDEMRKMCLAAPKYGNDDDYADSIAKDLYQFWADTAVTLDTLVGGKHKPAAISISAQWPGGALTGATPDGRYAGECLADGTMSPMRGRDIHGPTAVIKSAVKIDQAPYQSTLLNMKFHPSALKSTDDLSKLSNLIRTYFALGGKHIQFNVVGRDTLLDAQKHPENHRDLVVRVAGYSAYFIQLGRAIQDEIILRVEHDQP